ncbi:hypothetical protein I6H07_06095 [Hafnia alvei]|nr:hypothetical protein [Hafnia alvei]MBI0275405.1 hypothetical protein [Hafnia alvei]PNK98601.1 hypothetical protein CEQ28_013905 [Hafnia alvei]
MPFLRQVSVEIFDKTEEAISIVFSRNRIDFEYYSALGWAGDYGTITLYNLSNDEVKTLQNRKYGDLNVILRAGYDTGQLANYNTANDTSSGVTTTNIIFTGVITNVVSYKRTPEHVTHLYCIPDSVLSATNININLGQINSGMNLKAAMGSMAISAGFSGTYYYGVSDSVLNFTFKNDRVFHKTFMDEFRQLCQEFHLTFSFQSNFISVYPESVGNGDIILAMSETNKPIILQPQDVIGNPVAGSSTLELSTLLNASIQTGMVIDITKLLGGDGIHPSLDGVINYNMGYQLTIDGTQIANGTSSQYLIKSLVHHGSTHTNEFQTDLQAVYGVNDRMGSIEHNWRDWCTKVYDLE